MQALLTVVSSSYSTVHSEVLLQVVRTCYNVYLASRSPVIQATARVSLTQMVNLIFQRIEPQQVRPLPPPARTSARLLLLFECTSTLQTEKGEKKESSTLSREDSALDSQSSMRRPESSSASGSGTATPTLPSQTSLVGPSQPDSQEATSATPALDSSTQLPPGLPVAVPVPAADAISLRSNPATADDAASVDEVDSRERVAPDKSLKLSTSSLPAVGAESSAIASAILAEAMSAAVAQQQSSSALSTGDSDSVATDEGHSTQASSVLPATPPTRTTNGSRESELHEQPNPPAGPSPPSSSMTSSSSGGGKEGQSPEDELASYSSSVAGLKVDIYVRDALLIFRSLCRLSMKPLPSDGKLKL